MYEAYSYVTYFTCLMCTSKGKYDIVAGTYEQTNIGWDIKIEERKYSTPRQDLNP